jgi:hypothetical protein
MDFSDTKIRQMTGHKTAQMFFRYAHLRSQDLVAELDVAGHRAQKKRATAKARDDEGALRIGKKEKINAKIIPLSAHKRR